MDIPLLFDGLQDMDVDYVGMDLMEDDDYTYTLFDAMDIDIGDIPPPPPLTRSFVDYVALLIDPLV